MTTGLALLEPIHNDVLDCPPNSGGGGRVPQILHEGFFQAILQSRPMSTRTNHAGAQIGQRGSPCPQPFHPPRPALDVLPPFGEHFSSRVSGEPFLVGNTLCCVYSILGLRALCWH